MIFRKEYGHANIATLVERKSRYTVLFRNNDRQSKPIMARLIRIQHCSIAEPARKPSFEKADNSHS